MDCVNHELITPQMRIILINAKLTLDIPCMDMLRWSCKLNKRGQIMKESMRKEIMSMDLSELNSLIDFIRDVQVMNAKSSLKEGQQVYVVQKTKRELGTLIKIKQ